MLSVLASQCRKIAAASWVATVALMAAPAYSSPLISTPPVGFDHSQSVDEHVEFTQRLYANRTSIENELVELRNYDLVLVGEGHHEESKAAAFYRDLFRTYFADRSPGKCIFIELDEETYQPYFDRCILNKESQDNHLDVNDCEAMQSLLERWFSPLAYAHDELSVTNIFAIDRNHPSRSFERHGIRQHYFSRNEFMARSIIDKQNTHDCQHSIHIGGYVHLSGDQPPEYLSLQTILRSRSVRNIGVAQILLTGIESESNTTRDQRWHADPNVSQRRAGLRVFESSWAIGRHQTPAYPLLVNDGYWIDSASSGENTFGNWQDFDVTFFIDGY